jgi:hypothetical protein
MQHQRKPQAAFAQGLSFSSGRIMTFLFDLDLATSAFVLLAVVTRVVQ